MAAGATYEPIATTTLGSAAATITFSSIAATYTDLRVVVTGTNSASTTVGIRYNSDSATNYSRTFLGGEGTTAQSSRHSNTTSGYSALISATPSMVTFDIFSYAGSTYKTHLITGSNDENGSGWVNRSVGLWRSTSAITRIDLIFLDGSNFLTGTTATLYGIKAA